jgi:hypothetical protein
MQPTLTLKRMLALAAVSSAIFAAGAQAAGLVDPETKSPPTISGTAAVGRGNGVWGNSPTKYAYQWLRCDEKGAACTSIASATDQTYTVASADVGRTVMVLVTATNADGSSTANSKPSAVVSLAAAPRSTAPPTIVGKPQIGEALVVKVGTYGNGGGTPSRFTYQWQRCDSAGNTCTSIAGATGQSYGVVKGDVGHALRVRVRAINAFGTADTSSAPTNAVVEPAAPVTPVTTSLTASRSDVVCCASARLSGTISPVKAGEHIVILGRAWDDAASAVVGTATSAADGSWSLTVTPATETTYQAKTSTDTSAGVTIGVHPRIGLGFARKTFTAKVTARDSFAGKVVFLQRQTVSGGWKTVQAVVLDATSRARFGARLRRGLSLVRVYLAPTQAGQGYLSATSALRRIGTK